MLAECQETQREQAQAIRIYQEEMKILLEQIQNAPFNKWSDIPFFPFLRVVGLKDSQRYWMYLAFSFEIFGFSMENEIFS